MRSLGQRLLTGFHHRRQRPWQTLLSVGPPKWILTKGVRRQAQLPVLSRLTDEQETILNRNDAARARALSRRSLPRRRTCLAGALRRRIHAGGITRVGVRRYNNYSHGHAVDDQRNGYYADRRQTHRYRHASTGSLRPHGAGFRANAEANRRRLLSKTAFEL